MNPTLLGRLLFLNRELQMPKERVTPLAGWDGRGLSPLSAIKPVCWTPVQPLLSEEMNRRRANRPRRKLGLALLTATVAVGLITLTSLCAMGMERVRQTRTQYQLSLQLRKKERELHQVQQAYHALEAFVAVQAAREGQESQIERVSLSLSVPAKPAKSVPRLTRVGYAPVKGRMVPCSKRSNTGV